MYPHVNHAFLQFATLYSSNFTHCCKDWSFPLNTVGTRKDIFSRWDVTFIHSLGCTQEVCWKWAGAVYSNLCLHYRSTRSSQHNLQRWSPAERNCERRTCAAGCISTGRPDQTKFLMSVIQPLLKFGRHKDRNMYSTLRTLRMLKLLTRLGGHVER